MRKYSRKIEKKIMLNQFSRTELLFGKEAMETLANKRVAIFGIGGVGGYVCEALVRSGVMHFDLIDDDKVCLTNLNRQIIATRKTVGKYKADVMKERILEINPNANVEVYKEFFMPDSNLDIINESLEYLAKGAKISDAFEDKWAFPVVAYEMLVTGENTGRLPMMMSYVADYYQNLHATLVKRINTFIEPLLIIFIAIIVGIIVVSVVIPMFGMYDAVL